MWSPHPGEVGALTHSTRAWGSCDGRFSPVLEAFENNFLEHGEIGASVCIEVDGRRVVDLWAGHSDLSRTVQWRQDQLVNVFSVGKGVTALVAAQCVARGELSYETPVVDLWPEFGVHGKEALTFRDLLGHRAGLPAVRPRLPRNAMYDWELMAASLAAEQPWWKLDGTHGYHVNTFGYLVGELIRRATGSTVGQLVRDRIAHPHGLDLHLGCPTETHHRMAEFEWPGPPVPDEPPTGMNDEQLMQYNTYYNPSGLSGSGTVNTTEWRTAEIPSTNMHASAAAVAGMYSLLACTESAGETLLPVSLLTEATSEVSNGLDFVLGRQSRFAHGFQIPIPERSFGPSPRAFGHFGAGGSVGFADPDARVGFGYVMNQMGPRWQNPRNRALIEALYGCLG